MSARKPHFDECGVRDARAVELRLWGVPIMRVGIAYSAYIPDFLSRHSKRIDFVEVPYELLAHDSSVLDSLTAKPIILHCASLNIAGSVRPSGATVTSVRHWVHQTRTPWLGEHLGLI